MNKKALITGINGQDGSYLAEFLLEKGYHVHGLIRRASQFNRSRIEPTLALARKRNLTYELHYGNMADSSSLYRVMARCKPDEVYNLASQSHVQVSFDEPEYTTDVNASAVLRLLESIRYTGVECRFYQASSSEMFGKTSVMPQDEETPFAPCTPYGVAKLFAFWTACTYREAYGMHANNGILYNHESPRRGENFVTRKITYSLARIKTGLQDRLELGNLDSKRDWGYAKDYVEMMWMMLQQDQPDDYVIASGKLHTVRDFVVVAASYAGFDIEWEGEGAATQGIDRKSGRVIVSVDPRFFRPQEGHQLCGNPAKAHRQLGWKPKVDFAQLVEIMMRHDLDAVKG